MGGWDRGAAVHWGGGGGHQCLQARGVAVQHAAVVSLRAAGPPEALGEILQFCIARPADDVQLIRPQEAAVHQIREDLALSGGKGGRG